MNFMRAPTSLAIVVTVAYGCGSGSAMPPPQPPPLAPTSAPRTSASPAPAPSAPTTPPVSAPQVHAIALPGGGGASPVFMDYLAYDRANGRLWVPAGNTGKVDVIDVKTEAVTPIDGFPTKEVERNGQKRTIGPSSATVGDGFVYVGNRADQTICAVDAKTLTKADCLALASSPDGLAYVRGAKELWVTTPRDKSLTILDVSTPKTPKAKTTIELDGGPEGYAVDDARGLYYTNLEDKNRTLAFDVAKHQKVADWKTDCNDDGPRGIAIDLTKQRLFVACTDHLTVVDAAHDGAIVGKLPTGQGVDNIDFLEGKGFVYAAGGKAATLTIAKVDDAGALTLAATVPTSDGTRVVVVDENGRAYVADSKQGRVLVVQAP